MNDILNLFDRILYKGLYPWLKELNANLPKGAGSQKVYSGLLIELEGKRFLKVLQQEIDAAFHDCERSFLAHQALHVLEHRLERTALLISDQRLEEQSQKFVLIHDQRLNRDLLLPSPSYHYATVAGDVRLPDVMYLLQVLKRQLIHLYLEVQDRFSMYLTRNVLTQEDIHRAFFWETVPEVPLVVEVGHEFGVGECETVYEESEVKTEVRGFKPLMCDTIAPVNGVLAYGDIVVNKRKFAQLEADLFDYELLDTNYRFRKKPHGNVIKMAAIYWVAFKKGYFRTYYLKDKRRIAITGNDVRMFLNHRYQTNIERQFRSFKDEKVLHRYLASEVSIPVVDRC